MLTGNKFRIGFNLSKVYTYHKIKLNIERLIKLDRSKSEYKNIIRGI